MTKFIDSVCATIGAVFGYIFGGLDGLCYALLAFIIIDYISGVLVAISRKELSSEIGFKGISKKILIIALVGIANIIDTQLFKHGAALRTATISFYLANEGLSILENSANLGLPLPAKLVAVLKQLRSDSKADSNTKKTKKADNKNIPDFKIHTIDNDNKKDN